MKKFINLSVCVIFALFLTGFSAAFLLLPDKEFSSEENRSLRTFPQMTLERLISGEFSADVSEYFADQFPLRDSFVGIKGLCELGLFKRENNGVLLGDEGQLAQKNFDMLRADGKKASDSDLYDPEAVKKATDALKKLYQSSEIPISYLLCGRTLDIAAAAFDYPQENSDALLSQIQNDLGESGLLDTYGMFREKYNAGEYVYYKTDHHWTTLGAYYAYCDVMRSFGMENEIIPMQSFTKTTVATDFYGSAWSRGGMKFVSPDEMEFWTLGDEAEYTVTADGKPLSGFYNTDYLAKKDKYSAFLDGTHDVVTIKKEGEERQTLLLVKDSFANSLAPFLARHFDLVLVNLSSARTDFTNITEVAKQYGADRVMLVYTLENVVTANKLWRVK